MKIPVRIDREKAKVQAMKFFAVTGLLVVLAIAVIGVIEVGKRMPVAWKNLSAAAVSLSSVFTPADKITLTAPELVESGTPFHISWERRAETEGTYTLSYSCADSLRVTAENASGAFVETFCDTPFNFQNATSSTNLIGVAQHETPLSLSVSFTPLRSSQKVVIGTATIIVVPTVSATAPETAGTPKKTSVVSAGTPESATYPLGSGATHVAHSSDSHADLAVTIISTGVVDRATNVFTQSSAVRASERGAVRFSVENIGGVASGSWTFAVVLPTMPLYTFNSEPQRSLNPGDRIEFTLGFDSVDPNQPDHTGKITVNADPTGRIQETTEENNIRSTTITVTQ